ncbi:hypothetical protein BDD12DRAFT_898087 [Trichophaea hybrida]|nr:hypothetical protein BDD12DRAFT_898087 [Trichophaea hybrida]
MIKSTLTALSILPDPTAEELAQTASLNEELEPYKRAELAAANKLRFELMVRNRQIRWAARRVVKLAKRVEEGKREERKEKEKNKKASRPKRMAVKKAYVLSEKVAKAHAAIRERKAVEEVWKPDRAGWWEEVGEDEEMKESKGGEEEEEEEEEEANVHVAGE